MSDTTSTAAAEIDRATTERVRRPERSADAEQPPAEYSSKRKPTQAWRAFVPVLWGSVKGVMRDAEFHHRWHLQYRQLSSSERKRALEARAGVG